VGGAATRERSVDLEVARCHAPGAEALLGGATAEVGVELTGSSHGVDHVRLALHEKAGTAVLDRVEERAAAGRDGVPAASASRAASELVSSTCDGTTTHRAAASSRRLRANPTGPMYRRVSSSRGGTSSAK
jgi:hypothetical protein